MSAVTAAGVKSLRTLGTGSTFDRYWDVVFAIKHADYLLFVQKMTKG